MPDTPQTFRALFFPSWEVGLEMLPSALGALRLQVYCQVSDSLPYQQFIPADTWSKSGALQNWVWAQDRGICAQLIYLAKVICSYGLTVPRSSD